MEHPLRGYLPEGQGPVHVGLFFSGFKPRFQQYDSIYSQGIETPTLHIMGEQDTAVTIERSQSLVQVCRWAKVLKHIGGHDIPKSDEARERIVEFLRENLGPKEQTVP